MNDFDDAYTDDEAVYGSPYPDLLDLLLPRAPGSLLDLGSGQGRNAVALAAGGFAVTAVDSSAVGVDQTVARGRDHDAEIVGTVADLTDFTIDGTYDVVLVDMVLHGIDSDRHRSVLLDQIRDAVAEGGLAYVVVPERGAVLDQIVATFDGWMVDVSPVEHRLEAGEHAGIYEFVAVTARRSG